jgi:hypothetical protein
MLGQKLPNPWRRQKVVLDQRDGADVPQEHEGEEEGGDELEGGDVDVCFEEVGAR